MHTAWCQGTRSGSSGTPLAALTVSAADPAYDVEAAHSVVWVQFIDQHMQKLP